MKPLSKLTRTEYEVLASSQTLWSIYPEATGNYENDCIKSEENQIGKQYENDIEK